jgi:putative methylase
MGNPAKKRLIRKLDLELFLSQIKPHPSPQANLEQYTASESIAASMLYFAAYIHNDIIGKTVLDLGCGTGRLALAASFLGAELVVGVDIDKAAIRIASKSSKNAGLKANVNWVAGDIDAINWCFDVVLQNPPFGVQKRAADRKFLEKALETGGTVYSLHKHPSKDKRLFKMLKANTEGMIQIYPSPFIEKFVENHHGRVEAVYAMLMVIPRMFDFHKKTKHTFVVDLYLIRRNN